MHLERALPECVSKYKCPKATSKSQTKGIELVKITYIAYVELIADFNKLNTYICTNDQGTLVYCHSDTIKTPMLLSII